MHTSREELERHIRLCAHERFSGSGGPGGQHVNKTSSKVTLRVSIEELPLQESERELLRRHLEGRITDEDELLIHSSETRSQATNRRRAYERAASLISSAIAPKKRRKPTKPSKASKERRMNRKKKRGEKKRLRKDPGVDGA